MKFDVPEDVANKAMLQLANVADPNVKALTRIVTAQLRRPVPTRLTARELGTIIWALGLVQVNRGSGPDHDLEGALPKLKVMLEREQARDEAAVGR